MSMQYSLPVFFFFITEVEVETQVDGPELHEGLRLFGWGMTSCVDCGDIAGGKG